MSLENCSHPVTRCFVILLRDTQLPIYLTHNCYIVVTVTVFPTIPRMRFPKWSKQKNERVRNRTETTVWPTVVLNLYTTLPKGRWPDSNRHLLMYFTKRATNRSPPPRLSRIAYARLNSTFVH